MFGKILIVDGVATNRIVLKVALEEAFYQPVLAADGEGCLHHARDALPDLILLDLALPGQSGVALLHQLQADPATRNIPVLALAESDQAADRLLALQAGAEDVLSKPIDIQFLLARMRNLLRGRETVESIVAASASPVLLGLAEAPSPFLGPPVVSLLTDPSPTATNWRTSLLQVMTCTILVQSREEAILDTNTESGKTVPDVFLIDAGIGGEGLRLMSELRSRPATRHSSVCILLRAGSTDSAAVAYDMGADDVVVSDMPALELALRLQSLIRRKRQNDKSRAIVQDGLRLATIDPLTGLHNRRFAMPRLAGIAESAAAERTVFAVMIVDLDRFKSVNDRFGHAAGDSVLVEVSRRLQANLRSEDLLARIGGEEFLVALPATSYEDACAAADRLCRVVEEQPVQVNPVCSLHVTVSIGLAISSCDDRPEDVTNVINRADLALLKAKSEGRNKVTISKSAA